MNEIVRERWQDLTIGLSYGILQVKTVYDSPPAVGFPLWRMGVLSRQIDGGNSEWLT